MHFPKLSKNGSIHNFINVNIRCGIHWKCLRNTIKVSNDLDPDQDRHSIRPDLGQTLQKLSADDKSHFWQG